MSEAFDPLSKIHLGESVVNALLAQGCGPLPPEAAFDGAGVYAIYYQGGFSAYAPISGEHCDAPIYVGKAVPPGGRVGVIDVVTTTTRVLFNRLREHAESIRSASNLALEDFRCRYLVVDDQWINLAEQLLITRFRPVWNVALDGFGNHDPGKGRYQGLRPMWDVLHPGRAWADRCKPRPESAKDLSAAVERHLRETAEPSGSAPPTA